MFLKIVQNLRYSLEMAYFDKVGIHQVFSGIYSEIEDRFVFVNLCFDLHQPILEGLRFFYSKMVKEFVILVHDYHYTGLLKVREAMKHYEDEISVEIVKICSDDNQRIVLIA